MQIEKESVCSVATHFVDVACLNSNTSAGVPVKYHQHSKQETYTVSTSLQSGASVPPNTLECMDSGKWQSALRR